MTPLRLGFRVWLVVLSGVLSASAQPWSGIIDPSRAIDWRDSGTQPGVVGGIQSATFPYCNTTACNNLVGAGSVNKTTIEAAINGAQVNGVACSSANPCVVRLRAGTFTITSILSNKSGVTLRGAGASSTILKMTDSDGCLGTGAQVCLKGSSNAWIGAPAGTANWTAGFSKGTTDITLGSASSQPAVGMVILIDQLQDATDTGGIAQGEGGIFGGDGQTQGRSGRGQTELKKITAINGTCSSSCVVTITPPLHMNNWRIGQSPGVWWWGTQAQTLENAGVEDVTVEQIGSVSMSNISFSNAYNVWVKGVRVIHQWRASVLIWQAAHVTVRDSYFVASQFHQSTAYGIEMLISGDLLVENNIFHYITAPILGPTMGSVIAYNYALNSQYDAGGGSLWAFPLMWTHSSGGGMVLLEGNQAGSGTIHDDDAGNSPLTTYFRNHFRGRDDSSQPTIHQPPVMIQVFARACNFVGNVLGLSGFSTEYEHSLRDSGPTPLGNENDPDHSIYRLGYPALSSLEYDDVVWQSLLRWGNFDTVTATVRWQSGEIPTSGVTYVSGNAVPESQTLPASFRYTSRPSWFVTPWGTPAWPPIGPDVTGGTHPDANLGGRAYQIPARLCYSNASTDAAYTGVAPDRGVLLFSVGACYTSGPPAAPTQTRVVP